MTTINPRAARTRLIERELSQRCTSGHIYVKAEGHDVALAKDVYDALI